MRLCILTRSSPIAGGAGWYPAGLRLVACACAVLLLSPLLCSLLCFYFALYFASTLLSTLLNLIPNLIFESTNLIFERADLVFVSSILGASWGSLSVVVVFYRGGHALTTRNRGPDFLPPSRPLQSVAKNATFPPCYTKKPQRYFLQACEKPPKWLLLHSHLEGG